VRIWVNTAAPVAPRSRVLCSQSQVGSEVDQPQCKGWGGHSIHADPHGFSPILRVPAKETLLSGLDWNCAETPRPVAGPLQFLPGQSLCSFILYLLSDLPSHTLPSVVGFPWHSNVT
jgi:hypothetical protein